jgi:heme exporter protein A
VTAVVVARALSRRFGRSWALTDVDLEVAEGEAVALVGANGAGKSTLLSLLATIRRPSRGELRLFEQPAHKAQEKIRARLGFVGHATFLDDALTARENLRFHAALFCVADSARKVDAALAAAGLGGRAHDRVEGYSRGMRQRLSLARALLHDPQLLLLDEPFSGLDPRACVWLAERLRAEKAKGRSLVVATHQFEHVLPWCDRVVVLHMGAVVEVAAARSRDAGGWALRLAAVAEGRA